MALQQLRVDRTGTYRTPGEVKAENTRQIDLSGTRNGLPFPAPARPAAQLIQGRKLKG